MQDTTDILTDDDVRHIFDELTVREIMKMNLNQRMSRLITEYFQAPFTLVSPPEDPHRPEILHTYFLDPLGNAEEYPHTTIRIIRDHRNISWRIETIRQDGQTYSSEYYEHGHRVGEQLFYSPNGLIRSKYSYNLQGQRHGISQTNSEWGVPQMTCYFIDNVCRIRQSFFPNGAIETHDEFDAQSRPHGENRDWKLDHSLSRKRNYLHGRLEGEEITYEFQDGHLFPSGKQNYKNGILEGDSIFYFLMEPLLPHTLFTYRHGARIRSRCFRLNHTLEIEVMYENNFPVQRVFYDEQEQPILEDQGDINEQGQPMREDGEWDGEVVQLVDQLMHPQDFPQDLPDEEIQDEEERYIAEREEEADL